MSKTPVVIPDWIKPETWEEFKEHRKILGKSKVLNHLSTKKIINKLTEFRDQGYDPNKILDAAMMNGWTSVFVTSEMKQEKSKTRGGWGLDPDQQMQIALEDFKGDKDAKLN
tara:strand:+ start:869 stop:1204 length:336 start_codon:yes stop_codon:yes gene_type:complete